ncbi:GD13455 [Drosophila simulans]|uniref:GD13455 n=1 Tax=Drosophila simulans TaxID=7240 RepID=B4QMI2_DROSI|nr:GD13455 [Drosophila simulans]
MVLYFFCLIFSHCFCVPLRFSVCARKRPIPYHHKANAEGEVEEASSCCSSCFSRASSPATPLLTPLRNSRSPSMVAF